MNFLYQTLKRNEKKLSLAVAFSMLLGIAFTIGQSGVIANLMSFTFNLEGLETTSKQITDQSTQQSLQAASEKNTIDAIAHTLMLIKNEGNLAATKYVVESKNVWLMGSLATLVFFFISLTQFLFFSKDYLIHILSVRLMAHLRKILFAKFMTLPNYAFRQQESGDLISRTLIDVERIGLQLREFLEGVVYGLVLSVVGFVVMFYLNFELTFILFLAALVLVVMIQISGGMLRKIVNSLQKRIADISQRLQEAIYAIDVIKVFTREKWEIARFNSFVRDYLRLASREALIFQLIRPVTEVIGILGIIVVFLYAASLIWKNTLALEDLINFLIILMYVIPYLQRLTRAFFVREQINVSAARVKHLLDMPSEVTRENVASTTLKNFSGALRVENLRFSHRVFANEATEKSVGNTDKEVISGINFAVKPGQMVAVVGPSGSGKSTLISLLAMLHDPSSGTIFYDETAHDKLSIFDIRRQISVVSQENILLSTTLMENIRYGKLDASDEQVRIAAEKAHLDDLIAKLEKGLQTPINERGANLSGGEKQRVAIARAIIKQPKVLLLDEATSALDTHSEQIIQRTIEEISASRTTIVVAHRLSTVLRADKILVIQKGKLVEEGTHSQLLASGKLYKTLYDLQFHAN